MARDWQTTAVAGFGAYHPVTFNAPAGTAQAGIGPRYVLNVTAGRQSVSISRSKARGHFRMAILNSLSGSTKTAFDANAHTVHARLTRVSPIAIQPVTALSCGGAGTKFYRGIEMPNPRPLAQFGSFRDGPDSWAQLTFGGGLEWGLSTYWALRLDLRDYATPFPASVIVRSREPI